MQTVTVNKETLKTIVQKNRDEHHSKFERAFEGYRKETISILEENLQELKGGGKIRHIRIDSAPEDHTADYNRILEMLEMSVDEEIDLLNSEFQQYVQDDWSWSHAWDTSNTKYLG
jgi:hypothetical protein